MIVSGEQWRDLAIHTRVSILLQTPLLSRPAQSIEQSSMCYTTGSCWLSILSIAECRELPWRRQRHPTPVLLSRKSQEPGGLQSMGSRRLGHDWVTSLSLFTFMQWRRKHNPLQCSCLENPRVGGAWWAAVSGVAQSQTRRLQRLSSSSRELPNYPFPAATISTLFQSMSLSDSLYEGYHTIFLLSCNQIYF